MKNLTYKEVRDWYLDRVILSILTRYGKITGYDICKIVNREFVSVRFGTCYRHIENLEKNGYLSKTPKPGQRVGAYPNKLYGITCLGRSKLEELEMIEMAIKKPEFAKKLQEEIGSIIDDIEEFQVMQELSIKHKIPLSNIVCAFSFLPRENPSIAKFKMKGKKVFKV